MRMLRGLVAASVALVLFSGVVVARAKAKNLLVGTWEATQKVNDKEVKISIEFTKDGKVTIKVPSIPVLDKDGKVIAKSPPIALYGTYKVIDDTTIETTVKYGQKTKTAKSKIKVSKDELKMASEPEKVLEFKRVTKKNNK